MKDRPYQSSLLDCLLLKACMTAQGRHGQPLAGAKRRLYDPHRTFAPGWLQ